MSGFDDHERERIREALIETGRDLLLRHGPEKTTVADVTEPTGIAKSTFYRFFDSKAALYHEIFVRDRDAFLAELSEELDDVKDAETGVRRLFDTYLTWVEESPLLQVLLEPDDPQSVFRGIPEGTIERSEQEALAEMLPYLRTWQAEGSLRDVDPEVVLGVMSTAALMVLHREEYEAYDGEMYDAVRELFVDAVARGITE